MKKKASTNKKDFLIPENYFQNFENRLERKISTLESIPKTSGFKVPGEYFEAFDAKVISPLDQPKSTDKKIKVRLLYMVSSLVAVLILGFILVKPNNAYTDSIVNEDSDFDINSYIDEGFMSLNTYDIVETFEEVSLEGIQMSEPIPKDEIIEYLTKNNLDNYGLTLEEN